MNYEEFKARTTEKASYETFQKFEKMYMAGDLDKDIFCLLMKPLVVAMTEAAPFEREAVKKEADYHTALMNAGVAFLDGNLDAFDAALKDAQKAGNEFIAAKKTADSFYAKLK